MVKIKPVQVQQVEMLLRSILQHLRFRRCCICGQNTPERGWWRVRTCEHGLCNFNMIHFGVRLQVVSFKRVSRTLFLSVETLKFTHSVHTAYRGPMKGARQSYSECHNAVLLFKTIWRQTPHRRRCGCFPSVKNQLTLSAETASFCASNSCLKTNFSSAFSRSLVHYFRHLSSRSASPATVCAEPSSFYFQAA
jgi:hypothetical protein